MCRHLFLSRLQLGFNLKPHRAIRKEEGQGTERRHKRGHGRKKNEVGAQENLESSGEKTEMKREDQDEERNEGWVGRDHGTEGPILQIM